ncbi:MAG: branched-chain amino acid ABC transporter permease [Nitriliruptorales bacterium]|nr:branched-chain amino acid ABC transporter permease [Nitriliruptorales bacterium]
MRIHGADQRRRLLFLLTAIFLTLGVNALAGPAAFGGEDGTGENGGATLTGTVTSGEDQGVEGVEIVARTVDGEEVGTATTDAEGSWTIQVPGPGAYEVQLQTDSLPEEVDLEEGARDTRTVRILGEGGTGRTFFQLGESTSASQQFRRFLQLFANGIRFGLIIAMTAIGLSLIFGTTGLINFAHGELVTFGAIVAWFWSAGDGFNIHLIPAALIAIALTAALGGGLELGLFRPLRRRKVGLFQLLIITIGLSLVIRHILLLYFGGSPQPYTDYTISRAIPVGPITMPPRDLVIIGLSLAILIGVGLMLLRTRIGKAMRAVSDNRDLAESSGIDVQKVILIVWVMGGALAATGGIFFGASIAVDWLMGFQLLLLMFAGVILGGLGTAFGAMVGSLVVGIVTEVSTLWFSPELKFMWGLFVLIIVLLLRPQGILGRKERVG